MSALFAIRYAEVAGIAAVAFWLGHEWGSAWVEPLAALVGLSAAFVATDYANNSRGNDRYQADRALLDELRAAFPDDILDLLRHHGFGNSFLRTRLDPLDAFSYSWRDPLRTFHDSALAAELTVLRASVDKFISLVGKDTFAQARGYQGVSTEWRDGPQRERYDRVTRDLNDTASAIVVSLEGLLRAGKARLAK